MSSKGKNLNLPPVDLEKKMENVSEIHPWKEHFEPKWFSVSKRVIFRFHVDFQWIIMYPFFHTVFYVVRIGGFPGWIFWINSQAASAKVIRTTVVVVLLGEKTWVLKDEMGSLGGVSIWHQFPNNAVLITREKPSKIHHTFVCKGCFYRGRDVSHPPEH